MTLIFVSLYIPNILAIRLEMLKSRLANTFLTYDYIRTANIIKEDLIKNDNFRDIDKKDIYINGVIPIPFRLDVTVADPLQDDNFRYCLAQVFNDNSMVNIKINQIPNNKTESYILYILDGEKINNTQNQEIDSFFQFFQEALREMEFKHYKQASNLFQMAIQGRPFLLNYILSRYRLEDLKWITNGVQMRPWVNRIALYYYNQDGRPSQKTAYIESIMNKELDDYIQSLFYLSYLKYLSGDIEESKFWFSQIRFFEKDYETLYNWLSQVSLIKFDDKMLSFLKSFNNLSLFDEGSHFNTYEFERFLFKLIFNRQIIKDKGRLLLTKVKI